jgi:hypothetical protein
MSVKRLNFMLALAVGVFVLAACRSGPVTGPLAPPSNLTATPGSGEINLSWQDNSTAEEGFRIYRKLEGESEFTRLEAVTPVDAETFTDTSVSSVDAYVYQVRAFAGEQEGEPSNESEPVKPSLGENQVTLTVRRAGSGEGVTTSSPPGINCRNSSGGTCSLDVERGITVTLNANSDEVRPSVFAGFSGACTSATTTCSVVMDSSKEVTATYAEARPGLTVQLAGDGAGRVYDFTVDVSGSGGPYINCGGTNSDCNEESYWQVGNAVTLYAEPASGNVFAGWEGCATVAAGKGLPNGRCDFQIAASTVISARFLVDRPAPVINEFNASPAQVAPLGTPVVLSWDITYSGTDFSLEITDNQGTTYDTTGKGLTDSLAVGSFNAARTFTLTVTTEFFGEDTAQDSITVGDGPRIRSFTVGDTTITSTASTTLDWEVENADAVTLTTGTGAPEPVPPTLSSPRSVTPGVTTQYILTATKAGFEPVIERRTITVGTAPVFTTPLSASDTTVTQEQEISLTWVVTDATTLLLEKVSGGNTTTQPVSSSPEPESPTATTTYRILATNAFGTTPSNGVEVRVGSVPSITFTSEPAANSEGIVSEVVDRPVTLRWSVTGADTITLNGDEIREIDSRDATPRQVGSTPYVLSATNEFGTATQTITVTGTAAPPPPPVINSFDVDGGDTKVLPGAEVTFVWDVSNETSLRLEQNGTDIGIGQPVTVPAATGIYTYKLIATNSVGASVQTGDSGSPPDITIEVGNAPVINFFTGDGLEDVTITEGESVALEWSVTDATDRAITNVSGPIEATSPPGGLLVTPSSNITYTLSAANDFGPATSLSVNVTVTPPVQAPTIRSFNANPPEITEGSSSTLEWEVIGDDPLTVSIDGIGEVEAVDNLPVSPNTTTLYTLRASNPADDVSDTVTVTVNPAPEPATITSFSADPSTIELGGSSTLSWTVSGTEPITVTISDGASDIFSNTGDGSDTLLVTPSATTTYTLTATNGVNPDPAPVSVQVTVNPPPSPPVISSFTANPTEIALGDSSTLTWSATGTPPLEISLFENGVLLQDGLDVTGSFPVTPTSEGNYSYTLTAGNEAGSDSAESELTVLLPDDDEEDEG